MGVKRYGTSVYRDRRWPALRLMAKRRDGFRCVACGARGRLEVDHVLPVRTHPERAFDLSNLQTLCGKCHGAKTRIECGHTPLSPERQKWRNLLQDMRRKPSSNEVKNA